MGCEDACPYVPTIVDAWDIPDPAGLPLDQVREIRDMIDERVRELAQQRIDEIRSDPSAHRFRLARLLPALIDEFGERHPAETIRRCADLILNDYDHVPVRSHIMTLAHKRTREDLERAGLELRLETIAQHIDVDSHTLIVRTSEGVEEALPYDRLVIATGAIPARPPIPGIELAGVHLLHTIDDAAVVHAALEAGARSAVIIGAGYIGVEMADALIRRGLEVSVIEQAPSALTTVDPELGALVVDELTAHGVRCSIGTRVTGIEARGDRLVVAAEGEVRAEADIVLVLAGVQPDTQLARDAGANLGIRGAIAVDRQMRTGLPDIWAAGDCVTPTSSCSTSLPTCRWAAPPTSRGGSLARTRSAGAPSSPAASAPRS
jgi:NADPH-dependent 2,4-dienoyl-CoA reductase/sulfur reductase-like enzyme